MNKKIIFVGIGVVVLILVGGYFIFSQGENGDIQIEEGVDRPERSNLQFDLEYLDSEKVKNMRLFGRFPIEKGEPGRSNPFLPY